MIRVLVVEDSSTVRALLVGMFASEPQGFSVVGEAQNGLEAVELARRLRPDVVTMDLRMPLLDGLEATRLIMMNTPTPVVVISGSDSLEVQTSMRALEAGALAVLEKPAGPAQPGFEERRLALLQTVRLMAGVKVVRRTSQRQEPRAVAPPRPLAPSSRNRVQAVAIATSTGGPVALETILERLPGDFPVPILVVQHLAKGFLGGLATWLGSASKLRVKVAEPGEQLAAGVVYLAPDELHLGVTADRRVALSAEPALGGFRPSGTFLFDSVARALGPGALALILTGMGRDGLDGLRTVKAKGGRILAQDEKSSVVFGMPAAAIDAQLADEVVALEDVAGRLLALVAA